jgi:hypothetical protein
MNKRIRKKQDKRRQDSPSFTVSMGKALQQGYDQAGGKPGELLERLVALLERPA